LIREFRAADAPAVVGLLKSQFPDEEALLGTRPEAVFRVIRRVTRLDARLLFALLRLVGRPIFRMLIVEENGKLVGTTLLTFPGRSVYLSMVVVDPAVRRRGFARALLGRAQEVAQHLGRQYLVLDVLAHNTPARALYEQRLGYRPLRQTSFMAREHPQDVGPERTSLPPGIRPYQPSDEPALLAIARRLTPPEVQRVLPVPKRLVGGDRMGDRIFESKSAAWVVDRGHGAEALVVSTVSPGQEAGHLSDPLISETVDEGTARELLRTAVAWCGARGSTRVLALVPTYNRTARAALEPEGFHDALSTWTLFLPVP